MLSIACGILGRKKFLEKRNNCCNVIRIISTPQLTTNTKSRNNVVKIPTRQPATIDLEK